MLDIDFRAVWTMGKGEFSLWFVPAGLLTNLLYIRKSLKLSWAKSCSADLIMTAISWLVTVALPLWLVLWAGVHTLLLDKFANGNATLGKLHPCTSALCLHCDW